VPSVNCGRRRVVTSDECICKDIHSWDPSLRVVYANIVSGTAGISTLKAASASIRLLPSHTVTIMASV
jgi:hypothetical protein